MSFGMIFTVFPTTVSVFLSNDNPAPTLVILVLGIGLTLHGIHLLWASQQAIVNKGLIQYFSAGDFLWVLATLMLITFKVWVTTLYGVMAALLVAIAVGMLGIAQLTKTPAPES